MKFGGIDMKIFVLMPFKKQFDPVFELIKQISNTNGFICSRADSIPGKRIVKDIVENICYCDAIIADISQYNPNVFYEIGISHSMGCKTIIIMDTDTQPPFDIQPYRIIRYDLKNDKIVNQDEFTSVINESLKKIRIGEAIENPVQDFIPLDYMRLFHGSLRIQRSTPRDTAKQKGYHLNILAISPHAEDVAQGCLGTLLYFKERLKAKIYIEILIPGSDKALITQSSNKPTKRYNQIVKWSSLVFNTKLLNIAEFGYSKSPRTDFHIRTDPECKLSDSNFDNQTREIREIFISLQKSIEPDIVMVPSLCDTHQDHRTVAECAIQVFRRGESIWHYEIPHLNTNSWHLFNPNLFINVAYKPQAKFLQKYESYADVKVSTLINSFSETEIKKWWFYQEFLLSNMRRRAVEGHQTHEKSDKELAFAEAFEAKLYIS